MNDQSTLTSAPSLITNDLRELCDVQSESRDVKQKLAALTKLAAAKPQELLPHIDDVGKLLDSASGAVREGSLETLTLLSRAAPGAMAALLPRLHQLLANEPQNLVADRAIEILTNYAKTSKQAAQKVVPIFATTIDTLGVRNAAKILKGLGQVVREVPAFAQSAVRIAQQFETHISSTLRNAAKKLSQFATVQTKRE